MADPSIQTVSPTDALNQLWTVLGQPANVLPHATFTGTESVLPSLFAVDALTQSTITVVALATTRVDALCNGRQQTVSVDTCHAALEFRSERYFRVDGQSPPESRDKIAGFYRCGDSRWVHLHTSSPRHRDGVLKLPGYAHDRDTVTAALNQWKVEAFEEAAAQVGIVVTTTHTLEEWGVHP